LTSECAEPFPIHLEKTEVEVNMEQILFVHTSTDSFEVTSKEKSPDADIPYLVRGQFCSTERSIQMNREVAAYD
jgi:hypothetical protein